MIFGISLCPGGSEGKASSACNAGDLGSIPGLGNLLEEEMATHPGFLPVESQGLGAWWAAVYGVAQSRTRLK